MSQRVRISGIQRRRPELTLNEQNIYNLIRSKGDLGIWKGELRKELNFAFSINKFDRLIYSLKNKQMIKEVDDIQSVLKKRLMATRFHPSKELTGGEWYKDGNLNEELIEKLKALCKRQLIKQKLATVYGVLHGINKTKAFKVDLTVDPVKEILDLLVLEKAVVVMKGNGKGELACFPIGANCYKIKSRSKFGAFGLFPCGVCPRIDRCSTDGIISPTTCVYYKNWLEF